MNFRHMTIHSGVVAHAPRTMFRIGAALSVLLICGLAPTTIFAQRSIQIDQLAFTTERFPDANNGGTLAIFVKNTGTLNETISSVTINGTEIATLVSNNTLRYWRKWPATIAPGKVGHVQTHGRGLPLNEGAVVTIQVTTSAGTTASVSQTLVTPKLRVGTIIPTRDRASLYIYMRNLDTVPHEIQQVFVDSDVTAEGEFLGGTTIPPQSVGIFHWPAGRVLAKGEHLGIYLRSLRDGTTPSSTGAWYRVIEPLYVIGTYMWAAGQAPSPSQPLERFFRRMQGNLVTSTLYWPEVQALFDRYGVYNFAYTGNPPNLQLINDATNLTAVHSWMIRDEPDIANIPIATINEWNETYWNANSPRPTGVTLANRNLFAEYNNVPDISIMDHYAHYAPLTGPAGLANTLLFTRQLKWRTEPRLQWAYGQLGATSGWSRQPDPWSVNVQFWSHVLAGVKGVKWFYYDRLNENNSSVGMESSATYQPALTESVRLGEHFAQIRELCLYSESIDSVEIQTTTGSIGASALIGQDAMVVIAVNLNDSRPVFQPWVLGASSGNLVFDVPDWIPLDAVKELTWDTLTDASHSLAGRRVTIPVALNGGTSSDGWSRVFVIGRNDESKPQAPANLNVAQVLSGSSFILAWHDAQDNYGVKGYRVYRDNVLVADTRTPWIEVNEASSNFNRYRVASYDAWGNSSDDADPTPTPTPTATPTPSPTPTPDDGKRNVFRQLWQSLQ